MRPLILAAVVALAALAGGAPASAAERAPDEHCTRAPDYPLGWNFNEACRGHDECIDALGRPSPVPERLACDDEFLEAMLEAPHLARTIRCHESALCRLIAGIYYHVVRLVTLIGGGAFEAAHPGILPRAP